MKIPKKIYIPLAISISVFWILSIVLVIKWGFENTRKLLGFISSIIGLPTAIINLFGIIYIMDEGKLINRTLIEAGKKDQEEYEKANGTMW